MKVAAFVAFPNDVCKIQLLRHPSLSSNYHSSDVPSSGDSRQTTFVGLSAIPLFLSNTHTQNAHLHVVEAITCACGGETGAQQRRASCFLLLFSADKNRRPDYQVLFALLYQDTSCYFFVACMCWRNPTRRSSRISSLPFSRGDCLLLCRARHDISRGGCQHDA